MPNVTDRESSLRENLKDAGCSKELAEQIITLAGQGKEADGLTLLAEHRKQLLESCHAEQKKLDCLDYLVYQIEKAEKSKQ